MLSLVVVLLSSLEAIIVTVFLIKRRGIMTIIALIIILIFLKSIHFILFEQNDYQVFEKIGYLFLLTLAPIAAIKLVDINVEKLFLIIVHIGIYIASVAITFFYVFTKKAQRFDALKKREIYKSLIITLIGLLIMYFTRG